MRKLREILRSVLPLRTVTFEKFRKRFEAQLFLTRSGVEVNGLSAITRLAVLEESLNRIEGELKRMNERADSDNSLVESLARLESRIGSLEASLHGDIEISPENARE